MLKYILGILIIILGMSSCKDDEKEVFQPKTEAEKAYVADYDPPIYKWGFIDQSGEMFIDNIYDDLRDFSEGLAAANHQGKWGFINQANQTIIDFQYRSTKIFKSGFAAVQHFDQTWDIIDKKGKKINKNPIQQIATYDYSMFGIKDRYHVKIRDSQWSLVLADSFELVKIYPEHIVVKKEGKYQLYSHEGKKINDNSYDKIYPPSGARIKFKLENKYGFLDYYGKKIIDAKFDKAFDFESEKTIGKVQGRYQIIDKNGLTINTKLDYQNIEPAGQGYWKYKSNGLWGIIDKNGKIVIPPKYELLNRFVENRLAFQQNNLWGFLDLQGSIIAAPTYELNWDFENGLARVIGDRGIGFIDTSGMIRIRERFFEVKDFYEGLARVQSF